MVSAMAGSALTNGVESAWKSSQRAQENVECAWVRVCIREAGEISRVRWRVKVRAAKSLG